VNLTAGVKLTNLPGGRRRARPSRLVRRIVHGREKWVAIRVPVIRRAHLVRAGLRTQLRRHAGLHSASGWGLKHSGRCSRRVAVGQNDDKAASTADEKISPAATTRSYSVMTDLTSGPRLHVEELRLVFP
jgi:hypothetical protein